VSLIVDLDIEYVNFDNPAEAFLELERVFDIQAPVERIVEELLLKFGNGFASLSERKRASFYLAYPAGLRNV
jgi:hypothetical protein